MIKSIALKNFRGFRDHTIDFTPFCLLIGQNNAGKTTLIEGLRIISVALQRAVNAKFIMMPDEFSSEITGPVFRFGLDTLDVEHRGMHYNYQSEESAVIKLIYNNNYSITVLIGAAENDIFCQLAMPAGKKINSKAKVTKRFTPIFVMPPVGALLSEETQRNKKYLAKHINGYLSYRHIRNQMFDLPDEFERFKELISSTWSTNLQIGDVEYGLGDLQNLYGLTIRDGPFVSEVSLVGSGLQAWIQTIWFLSRVDADSIVVLDEPDVFLHADLQKKLIKILAVESYRQTIVATHSMEMISDVSPNEIVSVKKRDARSRPLSSNAQAQRVADSIGTNLNIQLSKLANSGKLIFVEGKDYAFLNQMAFKMGNAHYDAFSKIPHFSVGGMNNWPRAATASKVFYETSAGKVEGVMFVDRDYKDDNYFEHIKLEACKDYLYLHIWPLKEIENFFINKKLIHSYLTNRAKEVISLSDVSTLLDDIESELVRGLQIMVADSIQANDRKIALPTAMEKAEKFLEEFNASGGIHRNLISGKKVFSLLSGETQKRWQVSLAPMSLCRHMSLEDVPIELCSAIRNLL